MDGAAPCLEQGETNHSLVREKEWGPKLWNRSKRAWQPMTESTLLQGQWEQGSDEEGHVFYINWALNLSSRSPPPGPELIYYTKGVVWLVCHMVGEQDEGTSRRH